MDLTSVMLVFEFFHILSLIQWNSKIKQVYSLRLQRETLLSLRNMTTETWHISENTLPHCCCLVLPSNHPESFREKRGRSRDVCDTWNKPSISTNQCNATMNTSTEDDCSQSVAGHEDEGLLSQHLRGGFSCIAALSYLVNSLILNKKQVKSFLSTCDTYLPIILCPALPPYTLKQFSSETHKILNHLSIILKL